MSSPFIEMWSTRRLHLLTWFLVVLRMTLLGDRCKALLCYTASQQYGESLPGTCNDFAKKRFGRVLWTFRDTLISSQHLIHMVNIAEFYGLKIICVRNPDRLVSPPMKRYIHNHTFDLI